MMPSVRISTGIEEPNAATTTSPNIFDGTEPARARAEHPADPGGRKPEQDTGSCRQQGRNQRDADRVACTGENARKQVTTEIVGSEQKFPAHTLEDIGVLNRAWIVRRDPGADQSHCEPKQRDTRRDGAYVI